MEKAIKFQKKIYEILYTEKNERVNFIFKEENKWVKNIIKKISLVTGLDDLSAINLGQISKILNKYIFELNQGENDIDKIAKNVSESSELYFFESSYFLYSGVKPDVIFKFLQEALYEGYQDVHELFKAAYRKQIAEVVRVLHAALKEV